MIECSLESYGVENVICIGGGLGVMEVGNLGVIDVGGVFIGLLIVLLYE